MGSQSDRVETVLRQLHETERERRKYAKGGPLHDFKQHSDLAGQVRHMIDTLPQGDLKALSLRMVVDTLNGDLWPRCESCGRPSYLGEATR